MKDEQEKTDKKGAAVRFPPPIIFIILMLLGYGLQYIFPLPLTGPLTGSVILSYLGGALVLLSLVCVFYLNRVFNRLKTHIEPWKPTSAIITTGVYAYSRNPIYVAFSVFTIGVGLMINSLWVLMSFLPASMVVYVVAIKKEEAYLEQKFGEEYLNYKNKVRRWF